MTDYSFAQGSFQLLDALQKQLSAERDYKSAATQTTSFNAAASLERDVVGYDATAWGLEVMSDAAARSALDAYRNVATFGLELLEVFKLDSDAIKQPGAIRALDALRVAVGRKVPNVELSFELTGRQVTNEKAETPAKKFSREDVTRINDTLVAALEDNPIGISSTDVYKMVRDGLDLDDPDCLASLDKARARVKADPGSLDPAAIEMLQMRQEKPTLPGTTAEGIQRIARETLRAAGVRPRVF